jgi:hypothetical protein
MYNINKLLRTTTVIIEDYKSKTESFTTVSLLAIYQCAFLRRREAVWTRPSMKEIPVKPARDFLPPSKEYQLTKGHDNPL